MLCYVMVFYMISQKRHSIDGKLQAAPWLQGHHGSVSARKSSFRECLGAFVVLPPKVDVEVFARTLEGLQPIGSNHVSLSQAVSFLIRILYACLSAGAGERVRFSGVCFVNYPLSSVV